VLRRAAETLKQQSVDPSVSSAARQTAEDALMELYLEAVA